MKKIQKWWIWGIALLLTAFFQFWYCREIMPRSVQLVQAEIVLPKLPPAWDGVRLALISDLHGERSDVQKGLYRNGATLIRNARPDAVFFLGDSFNRFPEEKNLPPEELAEIMADFVPDDCPAFAVTGNHDTWESNLLRQKELETHLSSRGIRTLHDEGILLSLRGAEVELGGVDDLPECWANVGSVWRKSPEMFRILLCHRPEYFVSIAHCADLMLAGHTHGGQVSLPVLQERYRRARWMENHFNRGSFQDAEGRHLYVTSGIGTSSLRLRMNCPPEVVILTLRCAGKEKSRIISDPADPPPVLSGTAMR